MPLTASLQANRNMEQFSIDDDGEDETDGEPHTLRPKKKSRPRQSMPTDDLDDDDEEVEADHADPKWPPGAPKQKKAEGPV